MLGLPGDPTRCTTNRIYELLTSRTCLFVSSLVLKIGFVRLDHLVNINLTD